MAEDGGGREAAPDVSVDEEFLHTVSTANVLEAWDTLQAFHARFLGDDPGEAWALVEVTHRPAAVLDEDGQPTGDWELVSSGKWKRDPETPTPVVELAIVEELPELDELEG